MDIKALWLAAVGTTFGLGIGNFFYQTMLAEPVWRTAAERSFFQAFALLILAAICTVFAKRAKGK